MRALVLQHGESEGAGLVGAVLEEAGVELDIRRFWKRDPLPAPDGYDLVLALGGPMSANDEPLRDEAALLGAASRSGRFTVGICLGSQLLARALGASVTRGPAPEIGVYPLTLTDDGKREPMLAGLDGAPMFHWHYDTWALPDGAVLLASSARYRNQAFRVGERTFGVQFHPECDRSTRLDWAAHGSDDLAAAGVAPAALAGDDGVDARGRAFGRALLQKIGVPV
jgi:GMP synthase (glutamine-hydrolysing)